MKLLMENWRDYQSQMLYEQEFEDYFNKHFCILEEGVIDWAINAGTTIKDAVVKVIDDMKDWTKEKIISFVKFMGQKMQAFIAQLKAKGVFKKYRARGETEAVKLLMTNKHIDLAVMIFTAAAKLTGGFVLEKIAQTPKIVKKFLEILENPVDTLKDLLGDFSDVAKVIQKFMVYRKDLNDPNFPFKQWSDFGGLAEHLSNETPT